MLTLYSRVTSIMLTYLTYYDVGCQRRTTTMVVNFFFFILKQMHNKLRNNKSCMNFDRFKILSTCSRVQFCFNLLKIEVFFPIQQHIFRAYTKVLETIIGSLSDVLVEKIIYFSCNEAIFLKVAHSKFPKKFILNFPKRSYYKTYIVPIIRNKLCNNDIIDIFLNNDNKIFEVHINPPLNY